MQSRALFALVNFGVVAAVLLVIFLFPRYSGYAIYVFLGWFVLGLSTVWIARGTTPAGAASPAAAAGAGAALPSASASLSASSSASGPSAVGFCIYCAADLPAGTDRCGACGHARARLA